MKIVALMGSKGAGKDTVAKILKESVVGFDNVFILSFADSLKKATAEIFSFDVNMLSGNTPKSREWREMEIKPLSKKMGTYITPRILLQKIGTDILRKKLYDGIWIDSVIYKIKKLENSTKGENLYIITDCRFKNEIKAFKDIATFITIVRTHNEAYKLGIRYHTTKNPFTKLFTRIKLRKIHRSEWDWTSAVKDSIIIYNTKNGIHHLKNALSKYFTLKQGAKNEVHKSKRRKKSNRKQNGGRGNRSVHS